MSLTVNGLIGLLTNFLAAALIPLGPKAKDVITNNPPLAVTLTVMLFLILIATCLLSLHTALNCYFRTGSLRRFAIAILVAYFFIASFFLVNNYGLPDTYCLPPALMRILFISLGLYVGLVFGVLIYELERVTHHERRRTADRRLLPFAHG